MGVLDEAAPPYEDLRINEDTSRHFNWKMKWMDLDMSDTILGTGHFGEVRKGTYKGDDSSIPVAVKTLKSKNIGYQYRYLATDLLKLLCV